MFLALALGLILAAAGCLKNPTPAIPTSQGYTQATAPTVSPAPIGLLKPVRPASIPLSGEWRFAVDASGDGETQGWAGIDFDDSAWTTVNVPHTWNVMSEYSNYAGLAWYRRSFPAPVETGDAHLGLRFEAVFYRATVWLNGQLLGAHEGGYTPFKFDISGIVKPGGDNVLAVQVDNKRAYDRIPATLGSNWTFDWWNYGGLTRDVSIRVTSRAFIDRQQIVSTPHLTAIDEADSASVTGTIFVKNASGEDLHGTVQANLTEDGDTRPLLPDPVSAPVSVQAGGSASVDLKAAVNTPNLWHFDHPNLYRWSASLLAADGQALDTRDETFGIRSVELKNGQFLLNGEPVRLVGVDAHMDYPGQGSAESVAAMAADYNDLKTLNEVFTRPVHYPQAEYILDYADRHGILLIPEVPAWQLTAPQLASTPVRELEKQQLREMIAEDYNHPSVWAWSVGNEFASNSPEGNDFVGEMIPYVKSLDPSRPVGFATDKLRSDPAWDATALSDFVLMNEYFGTWHGTKQDLGPALDRVHQTWPDKTVIVSEFGFAPTWNTVYGPPSTSLDPNKYYCIPEGVAADSEQADAVRSQVIRDQMPVIRSKPFVAGAIFWSYADYRTPYNYKTGLEDINRNKRGSWSVLREEYSPALIDSASFSPVAGESRKVTVVLHTRGPVEEEMPAYTLRGYLLHWAVTSPDGNTSFSEGDAPLPVLAPGSPWSGNFSYIVPGGAYILTISIVRPTGFSVTDRSYDTSGALIP
jgi:hypothetical protein